MCLFNRVYGKALGFGRGNGFDGRGIGDPGHGFCSAQGHLVELLVRRLSAIATEGDARAAKGVSRSEKTTDVVGASQVFEDDPHRGFWRFGIFFRAHATQFRS